MAALSSMHDILEYKEDKSSTVDSDEMMPITLPVLPENPIKYKLCKRLCRRSHCKESCLDPHDLAELLKGDSDR